MKRHAVPQNIMDVEFKLFGSLSLRQFGYLASNVAFALLFYAAPLPDLLKWPIIGFFVVLGLCMALVNVNGVSFNTWFANFILALFTSQKRIWKKSNRTPDILKGSYKAEGRYSTHTMSRSTKRHVTEMPLLSEEILNKTEEVDKKEEAELQAIDKHLDLNFDKSKPVKVATLNPVRSTAQPDFQIHTPISRKSEDNLATSQDGGNFMSIEGDTTISKVKLFEKPGVRPFRSMDQIVNKENILDETPQTKKQPITIEEKVEEEIEEEAAIQESPIQKIENPQKTSEIADSKVNEQEKPNDKIEELSEEIESLQHQLQELQKKPEESIESQTEVAKKIDKVHEEIIKAQDQEVSEKESESISTTLKPVQRPNVLSGIIYSKDDTPISDVILEVKDPEGFPIRKISTDKNGQFVFSSPLPNGEYVVSITKKGRRFSDYRITTNGRVLPVLKFKEDE